jgi:ABC-type multidrug transport system fused ATPase/permease subunit
VRAADCIAVLERGRVGEAGPHAALAEGGGLYARLVAAQALLM